MSESGLPGEFNIFAHLSKRDAFSVTNPHKKKMKKT